MNTSPHDLDTVELFTEKYSSECVCRNCGTLFLARRSKVLCKNCYEAALFAQVKKYIQQNEVTEFEVANYFRIPLRLVKKWIREGRIDYKEHNLARPTNIAAPVAHRLALEITVPTACAS